MTVGDDHPSCDLSACSNPAAISVVFRFDDTRGGSTLSPPFNYCTRHDARTAWRGGWNLRSIHSVKELRYVSHRR